MVKNCAVGGNDESMWLLPPMCVTESCQVIAIIQYVVGIITAVGSVETYKDQLLYFDWAIYFGALDRICYVFDKMKLMFIAKKKCW